MRRKIVLEGEELAYELEYKNVRNINIRIKPGGLVFVSAGSRVPVEYIEDFFRKKSAEILRAVKKYSSIKPAAADDRLKDGSNVYFLGKPYRLRVESAASNMVTLCDDEIIVYSAGCSTDAVIDAMKGGKYDFIRCNYPNGDMVGHTGSLDATIVAVEAVDLGLARVLAAADECGFTVLITADHGNADEMLEKNKKGVVQVRTAHSLNAVPFIIYSKNEYKIKDGSFGLANVAPTVASIFGIKPFDSWEESMI